MYGDLAFQNSLLLTREVIKKAYNEGLYYISSEKNIDDIIENKIGSKRKILAFSGIPSFEEVCMNLSPSKKLCALKINLPYEVLAEFKYEEKEEALEKKGISLKDIPLEKVILQLAMEEGKLCYKETGEISDLESKEEAMKHLKKEIDNYRFAIENRVIFLRKALVEFLESEESKNALEDPKKLEEMKKTYEELMS